MMYAQLPPGLTVGAISIADLSRGHVRWAEDTEAGAVVVIFETRGTEVRPVGILTSVPASLVPLAEALAVEIGGRKRTRYRQARRPAHPSQNPAAVRNRRWRERQHQAREAVAS
jgi:hypothetical protein